MSVETPRVPDQTVRCSECEAVCCRLEVLLITETGVPEHFVAIDRWGGRTMARSERGWCVALDTRTWRCRIYENRPFLCREYEMGGYECRSERAQYAASGGGEL